MMMMMIWCIPAAQASDFAHLLWALAASNQLQSEAVVPLLASMGELPVDSFSAAALKQLAMVRASLPDPGMFAQHVPHMLQQAVDQASQPLRGTDLFKVIDMAGCRGVMCLQISWWYVLVVLNLCFSLLQLCDRAKRRSLYAMRCRRC